MLSSLFLLFLFGTVVCIHALFSLCGIFRCVFFFHITRYFFIYILLEKYHRVSFFLGSYVSKVRGNSGKKLSNFFFFAQWWSKMLAKCSTISLFFCSFLQRECERIQQHYDIDLIAFLSVSVVCICVFFLVCSHFFLAPAEHVDFWDAFIHIQTH